MTSDIQGQGKQMQQQMAGRCRVREHRTGSVHGVSHANVCEALFGIKVVMSFSIARPADDCAPDLPKSRALHQPTVHLLHSISSAQAATGGLPTCSTAACGPQGRLAHRYDRMMHLAEQDQHSIGVVRHRKSAIKTQIKTAYCTAIWAKVQERLIAWLLVNNCLCSSQALL